MTRRELKSFLKLGCDAIKVFFDVGRISEFNKIPDKSFPFVFLESPATDTDISENTFLLIDNWAIQLHIAKKDSADSVQSQYEDIIDDCDEIARKLIWQYNLILAGSDSIDTSTTNQELYQRIIIDNIKREPFIKEHAAVLTGVILSFTLRSPDNKDVC